MRISNVKGGKIMKLSKKWLSLLMAAALLVSCASALADSKFVVADGIAVKYVDTATDVVTADMFEDEGITAIGASCFKGTDVTSVSIPETVSSIQAQAFSDCRNLRRYNGGIRYGGQNGAALR